jgi:ABC-type sugar transport system substrate-binding protein
MTATTSTISCARAAERPALPPSRHRRRRTLSAAVAVGCAVLLPLTGCSSGARSDSAAPASADLQIAPYNGPEIQYPAAYSTPAEKEGVDCTVGLLNPTTAQAGLAAMQASAEETLTGFGCEFIGLNANVDPAQQVTQFEQLLAQGVDAVIVDPVDPEALRPQLERAAAMGIPVVAESLPATVAEPASPYVTTNVLQGFDQMGYYPIATLAAAEPGAEFGIVGFGVPVAQLRYQVSQMKLYAEQKGLRFLGQTDAAGDTASQYADAASNLLTRYPTMKAIVCFNDSAAQAAAGVARASGRDVMVIGVNGDPQALDLVRSGAMFATAQVGYSEIGRQLGYAAYSLITEQNLPLPSVVSVPVVPFVG